MDLVKKKSRNKDFNEPTRRLYDSQHATTPTQLISEAVAEFTDIQKSLTDLSSDLLAASKPAALFLAFPGFQADVKPGRRSATF